MILKKLQLRNFRNYEIAAFDFCPHINLILGQNAQGKTSALEAVYLLAIGRSFRAARLGDLIKREKEGFYVETTFLARDVEQKIALAFDGNERRILHNSTYYPSLSSLIGLMPVVVMTPDDDLIKGPPQSRRKFIDMQIAQFDPLYLHHLTRYFRAMRQRNYLLRQSRLQTIDLWEREMAHAAEYLVSKRLQFIEDLTGASAPLHEQLSDSEGQLTLNYRGYSEEDDLSAFFLKRFEANRQKEIKLGSTLSGPHRDDLDILIDGHEAKHFASEGQKRTCVAALRLASWQMLKERSGKTPLMLIDDFGLSLDKIRRRQFLEAVDNLGQVFITSVDPLSSELFKRDSASFYVKEGIISNNSRLTV